MPEYIAKLKFDSHGLIPAIAQDVNTNKVLMFAWMNQESLQLSIKKKQAVYYSRSRQKLWHKGEESGHFQHIKQLLTDCDGDVILLKIIQQGDISCHTGRQSCFFQSLDNDKQWTVIADVIKSPHEIY